MFASKSTRGFYDPDIHEFMPDDVLEISAKRYAELFAGQSEGKVITWGDDDFPVLVDPPSPTHDELIVAERAWRDAQLSPTDAIVSRHRDELESGGATTLTSEQYIELQEYRRRLRDWPQEAVFPSANHRPVAPFWLTTQL
ncbi:tail fiber assembly protein [Pseudomonas sp. TH32]|uniref:phage tail assembly chaperone n=1 Tax=Pseudomonas sp. TH32 TaxID=2796397 RepID=UPI0019140174|nr:phage tail assembly chaperone [Pseudomonas sp. TH32]MBK5439517.1 tail fiber assembly protein [Pseudomonas sp. TH32]